MFSMLRCVVRGTFLRCKSSKKDVVISSLQDLNRDFYFPSDKITIEWKEINPTYSKCNKCMVGDKIFYGQWVPLLSSGYFFKLDTNIPFEEVGGKKSIIAKGDLIRDKSGDVYGWDSSTLERYSRRSDYTVYEE